MVNLISLSFFSIYSKYSTTSITIIYFTDSYHLNFIIKSKLTARTRNGITSIMIRVDFTPRALKMATDPRTDSITRITPERPSNT